MGFIGSILSLGIVVTVYGRIERFILREDKLFQRDECIVKGAAHGRVDR
jgi:hypothetical protein